MNTNFNIPNFTINTVTYLSEILNGNKKLFKIGYYHYFRLDDINDLINTPKIDYTRIRDFLEILDPDKGYIVLPLIVSSSNLSDSSPVISLSKQILVSRESNYKLLISFFIEQINKTLDNYGIEDLEGILVLKYRPISLNPAQVSKIKNISLQDKNVILKGRNIDRLNNPLHNGSIIPLTMDLTKYGNPLGKLYSLYFIAKFNLNLEGLLYQKDGYILYILEYQQDGKLIQEGILFKDRILITKFKNIYLSQTEFIREFDLLKLFILNNKINYFERLYKNDFLKNYKNNKTLNKNIVIYDIETYKKDNIFIPDAPPTLLSPKGVGEESGWYDGEFIQTYYLKDFNNYYEMLWQSFIDLYNSNPNANVYIHNFSNFDYILLIKILFENFEVKPFLRNNKILKLIFNLGGNNKNIVKTFDSYLILPTSLRELAEKYHVPVQKGFFPYNFVNENNLDYVGITPDINFFDNIDFDLYENLLTFNWNLKEETLSYLKSDLISLYQVITKFALDIFNNEKIDITKLPTNSSIAFKE